MKKKLKMMFTLYLVDDTVIKTSFPAIKHLAQTYYIGK